MEELSREQLLEDESTFKLNEKALNVN